MVVLSLHMPGTNTTPETPETTASAATPAEPTAAQPPEPPPPAPAAVKPADPPAPPAPKVPTPDEMLANPEVARLIAERTKKEVEKAVAAKEAEIVKQQERAKLEETERLRLEKSEADAQRAAAEAEASSLRIDRDFNDAFMRSGAQLENPQSLEFVRQEARRVMETEGIDMAACVKDVLEKHAYLIKRDQPAAAPPQTATPPAAVPQAPPATASTVPPGQQTRHTENPSAPAPQKVIDTRNLSPQEYREYRRKTHGF